MLIVTITNVSGLTAAIQQRTNRYLHDVSQQTAQVIQERLAGLVNSLQIIGNSLAFGVVRDDMEFLQTKLALTDFEALAYVRMDGTAIMADAAGNTSTSDGVLERFADSAAFQDALAGTTSAGFYDNYVVFMEPISASGDSSTDGGVTGVMMGMRLRNSLEDMLVSDAFGATGFTFIIDQYGEILAHPMDEVDYQEVPALVRDAIDDAREAQEASGEAPSEDGSIESTVELPDGRTLLLDYEPLAMLGWAVVTTVDENFLVEVVNSYVMRIVVTVSVLMAIIALVLVLMIFMQRRYQKRIESVAFVDALTGGMSFIRFRMLAEPLIQKGDEDAYALVSLNVKRFKLINRLGGTMEGDDLLRRIYRVIQQNLKGPDEMAAHTTADSFALLLRNKGETGLASRLEKIAGEIEALDSPMPVRVSQGVYVTSDPNIDLIMFLDRSNIARISETHTYNSSLVFYDDDFVRQQEERLQMIAMIEDGLRNGEFTVYLQPKVNPQTEQIGGSEALVRWIHPVEGMIGPNRFIPLCEQNGLIIDLDLYVFRKVCAQIQEWQGRGWEPHTISVNVSGMHLKNLDFVRTYREIADEHQVDPTLIELELTESILFSDLGALEARNVIDTIHQFGFKCSMDDFGSGYSALGLLAELPFDCIKLDRSFFIDCMDNERALTIIASIIHLAQDLHITTVAEGIEDKEQVEMLRRLHCDLIQGFYYSPPLPMEKFAEMAFVEHTAFYKR